MKFKWEKEDVQHRLVGKPGILEVWMIGYGYFQPNGTTKRPTMVSMSDGLVNVFEDEVALIDSLTNEGYVPLEFMLFGEDDRLMTRKPNMPVYETSVRTRR